MWIFLSSGRRALKEMDRENDVHCTVCDIKLMHDIVTVHGTCGQMTDGADIYRRPNNIGRRMLHRACMYNFLRLY